MRSNKRHRVPASRITAGSSRAIAKTLGSAGPGAAGLSIRILASLLPSPFESKAIVLWLSICPYAVESTVALIVIVTFPPTGMVPFQLTTPPASLAVPDVAATKTELIRIGTTSTNSSPRLSFCVPGPPLPRMMV